MIVPRFWAEARIQQRHEDRQVTIRRFGWSSESQEDADKRAAERAREAWARFEGGEKVDRRERKVPYNGAEGVPIREEIVLVQGEQVVTRNVYGALCLNSPNVLFADIDLVFEEATAWLPAVSLVLAAALCLCLKMYYKLDLGWGTALGIFLMVFLAFWLFWALWVRLTRTRKGRQAYQEVARNRIGTFVAKHPDWRLRIYETPAGLRLLAIHRTFAPDEPEVLELFSEVGADKFFVKMCQRQNCFRARVSPKPWRIGIETHMRPAGVWPVDPQRLPERRAWVETYERQAENFASCRFLEELGNGAKDPECCAVLALHDRLCKSDTELPLA